MDKMLKSGIIPRWAILTKMCQSQNCHTMWRSRIGTWYNRQSANWEWESIALHPPQTLAIDSQMQLPQSITTSHSSLDRSCHHVWRPFSETRKMLPSLRCSTTHQGLHSIRLWNRFFALEDFGVTKATMIKRGELIDNGIVSDPVWEVTSEKN